MNKRNTPAVYIALASKLLKQHIYIFPGFLCCCQLPRSPESRNGQDLCVCVCTGFDFSILIYICHVKCWVRFVRWLKMSKAISNLIVLWMSVCVCVLCCCYCCWMRWVKSKAINIAVCENNGIQCLSMDWLFRNDWKVLEIRLSAINNDRFCVCGHFPITSFLIGMPKCTK